MTDAPLPPSQHAKPPEPPAPEAPEHLESAWKLTRPRVILLVCFVLTLTAGAVAGLAAGSSRTKAPSDGHTTGWISQHLDLTTQQSEQIHAIWSQLASPSGGDSHGSRQRLEQQRDQAIRALLSPKQLAAYDAVMRQYSMKAEDLSHARHERFAQAIEKTRAILTPDQQVQFDEFIKKQQHDRQHGESHSGWNGYGDATTRPAEESQ